MRPTATEETVQTATGPIVVAREGDPRKPAIVTYHDLALNYLSNFSVRKKLLQLFSELPGDSGSRYGFVYWGRKYSFPWVA